MFIVSESGRSLDVSRLPEYSVVCPVTIDAAVGAEWARLRVHLAEAGRRISINDLWIAATAAAHGLAIVTRDADFDPVEGGRPARHPGVSPPARWS